jgi:glycosyltransferase involved in cell wall biosynthesis
MRIGVDARELAGRPTGVGRYLRGLLDRWRAGDAHGHEIVLYSREPLAAELSIAPLSVRIVPGRGTWWEQMTLPRTAAHDRLDVFFSPAYSAPLNWDVPTVVAMHDVSFAAHPEWFSTREGLRRRWLARGAARRARAIVTISEFSRGEIADRFSVSPAKIHVVPPGVDPPAAADRIARQVHEDRRVLFVGSIFNRRHIPDLVRAVGRLARRRADVSLDIVGDNRTYPREDIGSLIESDGLERYVRWHSYATDEVLGALCREARAFAFLSEYEGLGLTPLEALAAGVPPVLLDTPVARESCGEAALYVSSTDPNEIADALERALDDEQTRARILSAAARTLARFDWPRAARDTLRILEQAAVSHA